MNPHLHIVSQDPEGLTALDVQIIRALLYFDIFRYPLTAQEIVLYMGIEADHLHTVEQRLHILCDRLLIYRFNNQYSIPNDGGLAERRLRGNRMAQEVMPKAIRRARLIQRFPFVRSVNISGSLSKNYFDELADVDFFVITAPGRLWLCRLLLTIYKKVFLLNVRKYFCINYYIDTNSLRIPDENQFSATEIITLKNQTGAAWYNQFMAENTWVRNYYPNHAYTLEIDTDNRPSAIKRIVERSLSGRLGNVLDDTAFRATTFFLKKKYRHLRAEEYAVSFRARKEASKHHPNSFQFKVMEALQQRCADYERTHGISLH